MYIYIHVHVWPTVSVVLVDIHVNVCCELWVALPKTGIVKMRMGGKNFVCSWRRGRDVLT